MSDKPRYTAETIPYGYTPTGRAKGITKDGHTMFPEDVVKDIQYLQSELTRLRSLNSELVAALAVLVEHHDYSYLDRGVGTATDSGKAWIEAEKLIAKAKEAERG